MSEETYKFYVKNLNDNSIWGIISIEKNELHQGWLKGKCVEVGDNEKDNGYVGAEIGMSAKGVFSLLDYYDYSEKLEDLI